MEDGILKLIVEELVNGKETRVGVLNDSQGSAELLLSEALRRGSEEDGGGGAWFHGVCVCGKRPESLKA